MSEVPQKGGGHTFKKWLARKPQTQKRPKKIRRKRVNLAHKSLKLDVETTEHLLFQAAIETQIIQAAYALEKKRTKRGYLV
jgi:hypothetical protein